LLRRDHRAEPSRAPGAGRKKFVMLGNTARHLLTFRGPLLASIAAAGHDVVAIGPVEDDAVRDALAARGVRYEVLPFSRTGLNPAAEARFVAELVARLRRHRPDVFFGYTVKCVIYGGLAARLAGVPHNYSMVSGVGYTFLGQERLGRRALSTLIRQLYRVGLAGCDGVFFHNPDDLAEFARLGLLPRRARGIVVNGSGVDLDEFPAAPLPAGPPIILFTGRLLRDKGIFELVDAARIVKARRPDVRFQLLGFLDPNPASATPADIEAWTREGVVEYLGETSDVRPYLAASTAVILPSYREGTPRSILEALATGRPAIVTDVPGCRETVVDGDNGYLVPPYDAPALADAVDRLLADRARLDRMAARARAIAENKYDARKVSAAMRAAMNLDRN
jgi:glycosyltransferase involved in cell wall biosynthesis